MSTNKMWGGRFKFGPSEIMKKINASIGFDKKLYKQDIKASIVHASMLAKQNIIEQEEFEQIKNGLLEIEKLIENNQFEFSDDLEDIHMNVESKLHEIIGPVAGKLHTARSRNDQVITDFKLWSIENAKQLRNELKDLIEEFITKAEENTKTYMPGFTHLQVAQPVTFAHHLMAYVEMLSRDLSRVDDYINRHNYCPLGSSALAGTGFDIDREYVASELGFKGATKNSMDTVGSRDFAIELVFVCSMISVNLSRFAEELVIWTSHGYKFVNISDHFTTGSSIMPQKRNPDAAELIRAKPGRIIGSLNTLLMICKGLTLTYSKDMQEDKEPTFDAVENTHLVLNVFTGMVKDLDVNKENMYAALQGGFPTATDIADWCVRELKMPFREAHHVSGSIVKIAEDSKRQLHEISLEEMQNICGDITNDIFDVITIENSCNSRKSFGGTSPSVVEMAILKAKKEYLND